MFIIISLLTWLYLNELKCMTTTTTAKSVLGAMKDNEIAREQLADALHIEHIQQVLNLRAKNVHTTLDEEMVAFKIHTHTLYSLQPFSLPPRVFTLFSFFPFSVYWWDTRIFNLPDKFLCIQMFSILGGNGQCIRSHRWWIINLESKTTVKIIK